MKHDPHSIRCSGYRGVDNPWDEDSCDCGVLTRSLKVKNKELKLAVDTLLDIIKIGNNAGSETLVGRVKELIK